MHRGVHRRSRSNGVVLPCRFAAIASSASRSNTSSDSANAADHLFPDCSSSSSRFAKAFCSTSGSRAVMCSWRKTSAKRRRMECFATIMYTQV